MFLNKYLPYIPNKRTIYGAQEFFKISQYFGPVLNKLMWCF